MTELRYNPLLKDWTMVASARQKRPDMSTSHCPFCPGSGKVPDHYDVHVYHNDFPVLFENPPEPDAVWGSLYKARPSKGKCEVILYSPDHHAAIPDLSKMHMRKLVELWSHTFEQLEKDPEHKYVMIFENRGEEVGATMPHSHGQIYAYPFIPLKVKTELESCQEYFQEHGRNMFVDMIVEEERFAQRIVLENDTFIAFIPFFTDYPFGTFIVSKANKTAITEFTEQEKKDLGEMLQQVIGGMDRIYDRLFPYMMVMHQRPSGGMNYEEFYRFHIEFYPPLRGKDHIKYNASSETGGWAGANPMKVEKTAQVLRKKINEWMKER